MDWVAEGKLQAPSDTVAAATSLLRMKLTHPGLQRVVLRYAAISLVYRRGLLLYKGRPATISDIPDLARAFMAGLTDDEDAKADTMELVLREVVAAGARIREGSELIASAVREHAAIWSSVSELVEAGAGPATDSSPLGIAVVIGDPKTTGLQFRNEGEVVLHNVVLAVDSTLATPAQGNVSTHTVFIPTWAPRRAILLPPRLMLEASSGGGGTVTYRLWADELRCTTRSESLPSSDVGGRRARGGLPLVLRLGKRGAASTAREAASSTARDATIGDTPNPDLDAATAQLDRAELMAAQAAFERMEAPVSKATGAGLVAAQTTQALVRYRLAETLRLMGFAEARVSSDDEKAKKLLQRAKRKYAEVLDAPDIKTEREGQSLHAAALCHLAHVDAILGRGYRLMAKQRPKEKSWPRLADAHEGAAERSLKLLAQKHANALGADGRTYLEAATAAVRQAALAR